MSLLLPKFLTTKDASVAVKAALRATTQNPAVRFKMEGNGLQYHIVILVPAMEDGVGKIHMVTWPNYSLQPYALYQQSAGKKSWRFPYDEIAQCKALQLWHERNDGGTDIVPHLLFSGDTPYWGGVRRDGIVVSCSGFQCHIDRMVAAIVADTCIGLAYNNWMKSPDHQKEPNFLS